MRLNIKVGSNVLVDQHGGLRDEAFAHISNEVDRLHKQGNEVAITTSGYAAAGGGKSKEAYHKGRKTITDAWNRHLEDRFDGIHLVGQVSLQQTAVLVQARLDEGKIPVTNGDFGDHRFSNNDLLAAAIARELRMDRIVLLGDMPGVCTDINNPEDTVIHSIDLDELDECRLFIGGTSANGTGGIETKFRAAASSGITTHYGHWQSSINELLFAADVGTTFVRTGQEDRSLT